MKVLVAVITLPKMKQNKVYSQYNGLTIQIAKIKPPHFILNSSGNSCDGIQNTE